MNSSDHAVPGNWGNCEAGCPLANSTSPWDFAGLCETGQCPAGWNKEGESCVLDLIGLEESAAREECGKYRGDFSSASRGSFRCKGGANIIRNILASPFSSMEKVPMSVWGS